MRLIDANRVSDVRSQTIYHGMARVATSETPDTIVFAQPASPYICIGNFQDPRAELNLDYCQENKLPVIRRETGGGAVYLDSNQLLVQWIFRKGRLPARVEGRYRFFIIPFIGTFKHFGIDASYYPINDVHVHGRKIVGTGAATIGNADVVTGNFMFDFDYETMAKALKTPGQDFQADVRTNLEKYLTTISREAKPVPEIGEVKKVYIEKCRDLFGEELTNGNFTKAEIEEMEFLDKKFLSHEWLFQNEKPLAKNRMVKIHAGVWLGEVKFKAGDSNVTLKAKLKNEKIDECSINQTALKGIDYGQLTKALCGTELIEQNIENSLVKFFKTANEINRNQQKEEWLNGVMQLVELKKQIS